MSASSNIDYTLLIFVQLWIRAKFDHSGLNGMNIQGKLNMQRYECASFLRYMEKLHGMSNKTKKLPTLLHSIFIKCQKPN